MQPNPIGPVPPSRRRFLGLAGASCLSVLHGYRLQADDATHAYTPPRFLKTWGQHGAGDGEFDACVGIAIGPNEEIYTAEFRTQRSLGLFDRDGAGDRGNSGGADVSSGWASIHRPAGHIPRSSDHPVSQGFASRVIKPKRSRSLFDGTPKESPESNLPPPSDAAEIQRQFNPTASMPETGISSGTMGKARDIIAAIRTLKDIEQSGRSATGATTGTLHFAISSSTTPPNPRSTDKSTRLYSCDQSQTIVCVPIIHNSLLHKSPSVCPHKSPHKSLVFCARSRASGGNAAPRRRSGQHRRGADECWPGEEVLWSQFDRDVIQAGVERLWQPSAYVGSFGDLTSNAIGAYVSRWERDVGD